MCTMYLYILTPIFVCYYDYIFTIVWKDTYVCTPAVEKIAMLQFFKQNKSNFSNLKTNYKNPMSMRF